MINMHRMFRKLQVERGDPLTEKQKEVETENAEGH